jgi:rubredoxin
MPNSFAVNRKFDVLSYKLQNGVEEIQLSPDQQFVQISLKWITPESRLFKGTLKAPEIASNMK